MLIRFISLLFLITIFNVNAFTQTNENRIKSLEEKLKQIETELKLVKTESEASKYLKQELELLKDEIRRLKLEIAMPEIEMKSHYGLGPAASKIYYTPRGLSIAGYGELTYENYLSDTKVDFGDVLRFVPYIGYKFSDQLLVNSELEIEHAGIGNVGKRVPEVYVEFLYIDFLLNPSFNIKSGLFLLPISKMNELHEPPVYFGTLRPDVERFIIPTVWREMGIMFYGDIINNLSYKFGIVNGLRTDLISDWIPAGRQRGAKINFDNFAGILRLDHHINNLSYGFTYYRGRGSDKAGADIKGNELATFNLMVIEAQYQSSEFYVKGLYSLGNANGNEFYTSKNRSKSVYGYYLETSYNLINLYLQNWHISITPFLRFERYNLNEKVFKNDPDPQKDRSVLTIGLDFKPHPLVVIKTDYQIHNTKSTKPAGKGNDFDEWKINQFNVGLGFIF